MKKQSSLYRLVSERHTPRCHTRIYRFETITQCPAAQAALRSLFGPPDPARWSSIAAAADRQPSSVGMYVMSDIHRFSGPILARLFCCELSV